MNVNHVPGPPSFPFPSHQPACMFPPHSLSFSPPHYDTKLHIAAIVIILNYFQFYLLEYKPSRFILLPTCINTNFFLYHNHCNFFPTMTDRENLFEWANSFFFFFFFFFSCILLFVSGLMSKVLFLLFLDLGAPNFFFFFLFSELSFFLLFLLILLCFLSLLPSPELAVRNWFRIVLSRFPGRVDPDS